MENQRLLVCAQQRSRSEQLAERLGTLFTTRSCHFDGQLLDTATRFRPGILIFLIDVPDTGLTEMVEALRSDITLASMKILVLSEARGDTGLRRQLYENGTDLILPADTEGGELVALLKSLARLKSDSEIEDLKHQFRSLITHETSTPLNAISSYASMIAADPELSAQNREMINAVQQASRLMETKIERVLLLSDLSADPVHDYHQIYSEDIFSSLRQDLAYLMPERQEEVTFSAVAGTQFMASFDLVRVACWNLLENALKYSPVGSQIQVMDKVEEGRYVFQVADAGPGIEVERLNTLLSEFSIDNILHHREGLGIGLSLCKRIVELHNGDITADNMPQGGARFDLCFPL
ncbi:MAG TPA: HAMP domain-containing histidine kinase [Gammaproteobacteria bacterium]|nr:HAMP domain-containing histidine kinase [Gammaproteobacteria bacterium]